MWCSHRSGRMFCSLESRVGEINVFQLFCCPNLFRLDTTIRSHLMIDSIRLHRKQNSTNEQHGEGRKLRLFSRRKNKKKKQQTVQWVDSHAPYTFTSRLNLSIFVRDSFYCVLFCTFIFYCRRRRHQHFFSSYCAFFSCVGDCLFALVRLCVM